jgi:ketosteroid isomerase-like protein
LSAEGPPAAAGTEIQLTDAEAWEIVTRMNEERDAAVLAGDYETLVAVYTKDAIQMQPDIPALVGRDAIRACIASQSEKYTFEGSNEILKVRVLCPDWILLRGTATLTATSRAGGEPLSAKRIGWRWFNASRTDRRSGTETREVAIWLASCEPGSVVLAVAALPLLCVRRRRVVVVTWRHDRTTCWQELGQALADRGYGSSDTLDGENAGPAADEALCFT